MRLHRTGASAIAALALAAGLAACGGTDAPGAAGSGDGAQVRIKTFSFQPDPLEVEAGTTVTWRNEDAIGHTVTGRGFDSGSFGQGQEFRHTFDRPGRHRYVCTIHPGPGMRAEVIVR